MKRIAAAMVIAGFGIIGVGAMADAYPPDTTVPPTTTVAPTTTDGGSGTPTTTAAPTTVAPIIPPTGSNSTGPALTIATLLLLAGVGIFIISNVRRRQTVTD